MTTRKNNDQDACHSKEKNVYCNARFEEYDPDAMVDDPNDDEPPSTTGGSQRQLIQHLEKIDEQDVIVDADESQSHSSNDDDGPQIIDADDDDDVDVVVGVDLKEDVLFEGDTDQLPAAEEEPMEKTNEVTLSRWGVIGMNDDEDDLECENYAESFA